MNVLHRRIGDIERDIAGQLQTHEVGSLPTRIDGIGPTTTARLIAELGLLRVFSQVTPGAGDRQLCIKLTHDDSRLLDTIRACKVAK